MNLTKCSNSWSECKVSTDSLDGGRWLTSFKLIYIPMHKLYLCQQVSDIEHLAWLAFSWAPFIYFTHCPLRRDTDFWHPFLPGESQNNPRGLNQTYLHKPLRKIKVTICNHQAHWPSLCVAWCLIHWFVSWEKCGHAWHRMPLLRLIVIEQHKFKPNERAKLFKLSFSKGFKKWIRYSASIYIFTSLSYSVNFLLKWKMIAI